MRLAKLAGGAGHLLIWSGVIVLLFVAYQLWGTNLVEARAQDDLEDDFEAMLATAPPTSTTSTTTTSAPPGTTPEPTTTTTTTRPELASIEPGEPLARIRMPTIGVDKIVVEGVGRADLRKGPGHYPSTPAPGQEGNAAIAGHRTTYGAPFQRVDELAAGDEIVVTTAQGEFTYEVTGRQIVAPSDVGVLEDKGDDRLTLTSCHPEYSARQRIVVSAVLSEGEEPVPFTPRAVDDPETGQDDTGQPDTGRPDTGRAAADAPDGAVETIDGDERGSLGPVILFGLLALAVWLAFYALSRRWRRWPSYLLGAVPFGATLFVWFGTVAELLPANF